MPDYRIVTRATNRCLDFEAQVEPPGLYAMGKRGIIQPREYGNKSQHFTITKSPIHAGFVIHSAHDPDSVLRYTPNAPNHKVMMWKAEPGNMKQVWLLHNHEI